MLLNFLENRRASEDLRKNRQKALLIKPPKRLRRASGYFQKPLRVYRKVGSQESVECA